MNEVMEEDYEDKQAQLVNSYVEEVIAEVAMSQAKEIGEAIKEPAYETLGRA